MTKKSISISAIILIIIDTILVLGIVTYIIMKNLCSPFSITFDEEGLKTKNSRLNYHKEHVSILTEEQAITWAKAMTSTNNSTYTDKEWEYIFEPFGIKFRTYLEVVPDEDLLDLSKYRDDV